MTKIQCTKCGEELDKSLFYSRHRRGKIDGIIPECKDCFKKRMGFRHQEHKDLLVAEFGGKCSLCGYNKCARILCFHHLPQFVKSFEIANRLSANLEILRREASKCILVCPNCHGEIHQGL